MRGFVHEQVRIGRAEITHAYKEGENGEKKDLEASSGSFGDIGT